MNIHSETGQIRLTCSSWAILCTCGVFWCDWWWAIPGVPVFLELASSVGCEPPLAHMPLKPLISAERAQDKIPVSYTGIKSERESVSGHSIAELPRSILPINTSITFSVTAFLAVQLFQQKVDSCQIQLWVIWVSKLWTRKGLRTGLCLPSAHYWTSPNLPALQQHAERHHPPPLHHHLGHTTSNILQLIILASSTSERCNHPSSLSCLLVPVS